MPEGSIYDVRFDEVERRKKEGVWREIARHLERRYLTPEDRVLDVGCDRGYFIRNVNTSEKWASDLRDTSAELPSDVQFVQADGLRLGEVLPNDYFDVVFMSNYLEHLPSAEAVIEQLRVVRRLLRPAGRVLILQPNIALVGGSYWDFIDHRVALTDRSLAEAARLAGLEPVETVRRFLPYSVKSRLPSTPWLVRLYLRMPLAWRVLGRQTLFLGRRGAHDG